MTYEGRPSVQVSVSRGLLDLLRRDLRQMCRVDGRSVDLPELEPALSAAGVHLAAAEAALSDYVLAPRFTPGQLVDVVSEDGTQVVARGPHVKAVHEWTADVVDPSGHHDTYLTATLRATI